MGSMGFRIFLFSCMLLSTPLGGVWAQQTWTKLGGPLGGLGYDIRFDQNNHNLILMTDNWSGVNRSTNRGKNWATSNTGIKTRVGRSGDAIPIFSLTIDPNNSNIVWAGTASGNAGSYGLFKSTDGGITWVDTSSSLGNFPAALSIRGFTVQSGNSNVVYAQAELGTDKQGKEFNRTQGKIFRTKDGGKTWTEIYTPDNLSRHLRIHHTNPDILYVSTGIFDREAANSDCAVGKPGGVGILKSTDGGQTWVTVNGSGADTLTDLYCGYLAMHPSNPDILFAACGNNACSSASNSIPGVFKTTNGGQSWRRVISGDIMTTVIFSQSSPNVMFAGSAQHIHRSSNGGDNWVLLNPGKNSWGPPGVRAGVPIDMIVDPDDDQVIYANNYGGGVFKSSDGGVSWVSWNEGFSGAEIHDLAIDPRYGARVLAIGRSGPFQSVDGGALWNGIMTGDSFGIPEWYAIDLDPNDSRIILMSDEHQGVIFRSEDGGNSFKGVFRHPEVTADSPNRRHGFKALEFSRADSNIVYAGMCRDGHPQNAEVHESFGVYKSTDNGRVWKSVGAATLGTKCIYTITSDPTNAKVVYAGTSNRGIYKSENGGDTWVAVGPAGVDIHTIAIDPRDTKILYAGSVNSGGVYKSTDGGSTWSSQNTGLISPNAPIMSILIHPKNSNILYAADWSSGVYQSTDSAKNWSPINQGLSTRAVKSLAIEPTSSVLFAATHGEGVFRLGTFAFGKLSGTIKNISGDLLSGAIIRLSTANIFVQSGKDGIYTFDSVLPASYSITVTKSGYGDKTAQATINTDATTTLNFSLDADSSAPPPSSTPSGCSCGNIVSQRYNGPTGFSGIPVGLGLFGAVVSFVYLSRRRWLGRLVRAP